MTTRDNIGEGLVVVYAALVCAVGKMVGLEFWAGVIGLSVKSLDEARKKFNEDAGEEGGFEGRGGSKEAENLVAFLSEIYNFGVVACVLIYDLTKSFVLDGVGMGELETELLVKVVKSEPPSFFGFCLKEADCGWCQTFRIRTTVEAR